MILRLVYRWPFDQLIRRQSAVRRCRRIREIVPGLRPHRIIKLLRVRQQIHPRLDRRPGCAGGLEAVVAGEFAEGDVVDGTDEVGPGNELQMGLVLAVTIHRFAPLVVASPAATADISGGTCPTRDNNVSTDLVDFTDCQGVTIDQPSV